MIVRAVCSNTALLEEQTVAVEVGVKVDASGLSSEGEAKLGASLGQGFRSQIEVWCFPWQDLHLPVERQFLER